MRLMEGQCYWCKSNLPEGAKQGLCAECDKAFREGKAHERPGYTRLLPAFRENLITEQDKALDAHLEQCVNCRLKPRRLCPFGSELYITALVEKIGPEYERRQKEGFFNV